MIDQVKIFPYAEEVELQVLGTILQWPEYFDMVQDIFHSDLFYQDDKKSISNAIISAKSKSIKPDTIAVMQELKKANRLAEVGGISFLSSLSNKVSSATNLEHNCRILHQYAILRKIIVDAATISQKAFDPRHDAFDLIEEIEKLASDLNRGVTSEKIYDYQSIAIETNKIIRQRASMSGMVGIPSGFNALDQSTGGWEDGTLIILAARPGMGKTAAMLQMAVYPALHLKVPTGIFSIEMPRIQISMRMMAQESGIDINKISGKSSNKMNEMAIDDLDSKCKFLYEAPIFLDDTPSLSLRSFRSKARKMVSKNGVKLLLVDYLQLMDSEINGSREQQVSKISSTLKAVAKELNVPIIALSSLNRSVEARPDKRPQLQDLRDSGAIESDADMVIFIYRPEYYGLQEFNNQSSHGVALFTIAKHRGGELGDIQLKWEGYKTKFSDNTFDFAEPHKLEPDEAF